MDYREVLRLPEKLLYLRILMGLKQADFAVVVLVEQGGDGVGAFFGNLCGGNLQGGDGALVGRVA